MGQHKHTPGPWELKGVTGEGAKFVGGFRRVHGDNAWVSFVPLWDSAPGEAAEAEANARLIAAAPDLLAALESVPGDSAHITEWDAWRAIAAAAIAKARGQQ